MLISAVVVAAFYGAFAGGFISDDWPLIAENPYLLEGSLRHFFTAGVWSSSALELPGSVFRPVQLLAWSAIARLFGVEPFAYHVFNVGLHCLNAVLVMRIISRLSSTSTRAGVLAGGLVFALHPAQVESVAWVAGGVGLMLAFFLLLGLLCWMRYRERGRPVDLCAALACCLAALLTQETGLLFPFLVAAWELRSGTRWRRLFAPRFALLALILGVYVVLRLQAMGGDDYHRVVVVDGQSLVRVAEFYLLTARYLIVPWPLEFHFTYPPGGMAGLGDVSLGFGAIALLLFATHRFARWHALAWMCFLLLPPFSYAFNPAGAFALRFLYLPLAGLAVLTSAAVTRLDAHHPRRALAAVTLLAAALATGTAWQVPRWKDEGSFYVWVRDISPATAHGYTGLGRHLLRTGDVQGAAGVYRSALTRVTEDGARAELTYRLAHTLERLGRYEESLRVAAPLATRPSHAVAANILLANTYWKTGAQRRALSHFDAALRIEPDRIDAAFNRAALLENLGDATAAARAYRALLTRPEFAKRFPAAHAHATRFLTGAHGRP